MIERHDCPGCGKDDVPKYMFACVTCWDALPDRLRDRVKSTARLGVLDDRRLQVLSDVLTWYHSHPVGEHHVGSS